MAAVAPVPTVVQDPLGMVIWFELVKVETSVMDVMVADMLLVA